MRGGFPSFFFCALFCLFVVACGSGTDSGQPEPVPLRADGPIRIPLSIDLVRAEPSPAVVNQVGSWRLPFVVSQDVSAGETLKLQVYGGRNNKERFHPLQAQDPAGFNYITARLADGRQLAMQADTDTLGTFTILLPEEGLKRGSLLLVTLGDTSSGSVGARVGKSRAANKFFVLYRAKSSSDHPLTWYEGNFSQMVGASAIDIVGQQEHHLRAYVPTNARPGEALSILVRPEDRFNNLSPAAPRDLAVYDGDTALPGLMNAVPGTSTVRVEVVLQNEGVHRLRVVDRATGVETFTNPVLCSAGGSDNIYWGMIHGHTEMSDGDGSIDHYFRQIRDEVGLDFAAASDHDHSWETSGTMWSITQKAVKAWNEPGRFVAFLGYEWASTLAGAGHRNVYYFNDDEPMFRSEKYASPTALFTTLRNHRALVIPHQTAWVPTVCDWSEHDPVKERLVEIFQGRGSFECDCTAQEGYPLPWAYDVPRSPTGLVQSALGMGWRVGFTAGGDDHNGSAGTDYVSGTATARAGLMAVLARDLTREAVWEALYNRKVIATTGPRIVLTYEVSGRPMGSELDAAADSSLLAGRTLRVSFHGTAPLSRLEILRNNAVVKSFEGSGLGLPLDAELSWTDAVPLSEVLLPSTRYSPRPFCFYYVRAFQTDGQVAWASPLWIDGY